MFHVKHPQTATVGSAGAPRVRYTSRTASAAGVTPGMRFACPKVDGRTRSSFCFTSVESPGIAPYLKSSGIWRDFRVSQTPDLPLLLG